MEIREEDFMIEFEEHCSKFNLYLLYVKNAKNPEKRSEELKIYGYGMPLEHCIQVIINYRIAKKKEVYTLGEYLEEYKLQANSIKKLTSALRE
jgi:hypothetical protein